MEMIRGTAKSMGLENSVGTLEPGKKADIILIKLDRIERPYMNPDVPIVDAVIHRIRDIDVDTVIINGEVVLDSRKLVKVDKDNIFEDVRMALARPLTVREAERKELAKALLPHLKAFYSGTYSKLNKFIISCGIFPESWFENITIRSRSIKLPIPWGISPMS